MFPAICTLGELSEEFSVDDLGVVRLLNPDLDRESRPQILLTVAAFDMGPDQGRRSASALVSTTNTQTRADPGEPTGSCPPPKTIKLLCDTASGLVGLVSSNRLPPPRRPAGSALAHNKQTNSNNNSNNNSKKQTGVSVNIHESEYDNDMNKLNMGDGGWCGIITVYV